MLGGNGCEQAGSLQGTKHVAFQATCCRLWGMSYRLLAFPNAIAKGHPCHGRFIRPELLAKLADLVKAGATIVWPRPVVSPGLQSYPQCDSANAAGEVVSTRVESVPTPLTLRGLWTLRFPSGPNAPTELALDKLISWTKHDNPNVRYFSGTAAYQTEFSLPQEFLEKNLRVYLDLGIVKNLAEVRLNGRPCGLLWKEPFRLDVTAAIKPGRNQLEVRVTNLWPNRLIGDTFLPEAKRLARTNLWVFNRQSPLLESGLLGPVEVRVAERIPVD
jgi:hypothetical protein